MIVTSGEQMNTSKSLRKDLTTHFSPAVMSQNTSRKPPELVSMMERKNQKQRTWCNGRGRRECTDIIHIQWVVDVCNPFRYSLEQAKGSGAEEEQLAQQIEFVSHPEPPIHITN